MKQTVAYRLLALSLALLCLLPLVGCGGAVRPSSRANKVVATAGNIEITYDELYYLANTRKAELLEAYGENALADPTRLAEFERFVWDNLLNLSHAMLSLAKDYDIDIEEGDVAQRVDTHMEEILADTFGGERDAYVESLNSSYLTDRYVRTYVAVENYLGVEIIKHMLEAGAIDSSDAAAKSYIWGDDFIRIRQVLIETRNYKNAEAALAKINELHAKVSQATGDAARNDAMLDAMMFSTSLDTSGHGIYFARGEMEQSFENAAFALPLYGVSEVMEVEEGYTFVMRLPKEEAYLDDPQNFETLKNQTYLIALNNAARGRFAQMSLTKTSFGESLDLLALPAIDADGGKLAFVLIWVGVGVVCVAGAVVLARVWIKRRGVKKK